MTCVPLDRPVVVGETTTALMVGDDVGDIDIGARRRIMSGYKVHDASSGANNMPPGGIAISDCCYINKGEFR